MDERIENILKDELKSKAPDNFTLNTLKYIDQREGKVRQLIYGILFLFVPLFTLLFIPFNSISIAINNFGFDSIQISGNTIYIIFLLLTVLYLDTLARSFIRQRDFIAELNSAE